MADFAVSCAIQKLVNLLIHEAHFLRGVQEKLEQLQVELERMQCFLEDADTQQEDEQRVRNWVSNIRNVAYDAEDLIDTFILKIEYQKRRGFVKRYTSIFKEKFNIYNFEKEIETIQVRIHDISRSRETYGIRNIGEGRSLRVCERLRHLRQSSPRGLEKDIVSLGEDTTKLVAQLVKTEVRLSVISIIGMGGIGKTTLAKKVYNYGDFDCRAWLYVSQDCRSRDILQGIIRQVTTPTKDLEKLQEEELETMLCEYLEKKRYLVVLDDIWTIESWVCLARAFPDTSNASRLMITTRNRDIALYADARSIPHELRLLSKEDSWELFCRKAFLDSVDTSCPPELNDIGRKIVAKCAGLPLAIIVIGGLLSRKMKLPSEWERVLDNMSSHFAKDQTGVSAILALSYYDLPYDLKPCFLYLGHFPEDYVIAVGKLFQLWIAEGLIPQQGNQTMESTAEGYLNELIDRNMVQAVRMSVNKRVRECRIHDLLRELSSSKAKEGIFLEVYENRDPPPSAKTRHQAIHSNFIQYLESRPSTPHLRSLLVFDRKFWEPMKMNFICKNFQLLRVLDLENLWVFHLPREIGQLINLRYLGLRKTNISALPSSMSHLQSIQTLDIREVNFRKIPNVISKMENLRHLHMCPLWSRGQLKVDTLRHLQTLSGINIRNWRGNNSKELSNLRKLRVAVEFSADVHKFFNSIAELEHLFSLHLEPVGFQIPPYLIGLSCLHRLTKLQIAKMTWEPPSPPEFPPNLSQLTLSGSNLYPRLMQVLEKLPKLSLLRLRDCYIKYVVPPSLTFSMNGFPQLEFLVLDKLQSLRELKFLDKLESLRELKIEGVMPRLKRLRISDCSNLTFLPEGIKFLSALQELEIDRMAQSFEDKLRGVDSYKVQHIPSIIFTNTKMGRS